MMHINPGNVKRQLKLY